MSNNEKEPPLDWADPGYFAGKSRLRNTSRILIQLIRPPKGHRTLPTKTGLVLIAITLGVGTAAFNTSQNILYLTLALLLSSLLVSGVLSWLNFTGCRWRVETGRHFRVAEPSAAELIISNGKKHLPSYALNFRLSLESSEIFGDLSLVGRLDAQSEERLIWDFTPVKRGANAILLEGLSSKFPFGFLLKKIKDSYHKEIVVWPERVDIDWLRQGGGEAHRHGRHYYRKGEGTELLHIRSYRAGDSLKAVHWKASARMQKLMIRETEQERRSEYVLAVNTDRSLWKMESDFEKLCAVVASAGESLYHRGQLAGYSFNGNEVKRVVCLEDLYLFFDTLSLLKQEPSSDQRGFHYGGAYLSFHQEGAGMIKIKHGEEVIGQA